MDKVYFDYMRACVDEYGADSVGVPPDRLASMLAWLATPPPGQDAVPAVLAAMLVGDAALSTVVEFRRKGVVVGRAVMA